MDKLCTEPGDILCPLAFEVDETFLDKNGRLTVTPFNIGTHGGSPRIKASRNCTKRNIEMLMWMASLKNAPYKILVGIVHGLQTLF